MNFYELQVINAIQEPCTTLSLLNRWKLTKAHPPSIQPLGDYKTTKVKFQLETPLKVYGYIANYRPTKGQHF